jgi:hypothetical protein
MNLNQKMKLCKGLQIIAEVMDDLYDSEVNAVDVLHHVGRGMESEDFNQMLDFISGEETWQ